MVCVGVVLSGVVWCWCLFCSVLVWSGGKGAADSTPAGPARPGQTGTLLQQQQLWVMATPTLSLSNNNLWSWCRDTDPLTQWWKEADWWLSWCWSSWCPRQGSISTPSWVRWLAGRWLQVLSLTRRSPSQERRNKSSPPSQLSAFPNLSVSSSLWRTQTTYQTPSGTSSLWSGKSQHITWCPRYMVHICTWLITTARLPPFQEIYFPGPPVYQAIRHQNTSSPLTWASWSGGWRDTAVTSSTQNVHFLTKEFYRLLKG